MRFAQLNADKLVMNIVNLTAREAATLTTELVPLTGSQTPSPGDRWDGSRFIAKLPPSPEDTETIRSIARAALAERRSKQNLIAGTNVDTATQEELRALLAALTAP